MFIIIIIINKNGAELPNRRIAVYHAWKRYESKMNAL